jgi:Resolvase, N terminal domain
VRRRLIELASATVAQGAAKLIDLADRTSRSHFQLGGHGGPQMYRLSRYSHGDLVFSITWLYRISVPIVSGSKAPQMRIGYARVSAHHQNLDRQLATLKTAGCKRIFKEKESGREGVKRRSWRRRSTLWDQAMSSSSPEGPGHAINARRHSYH